ncbi:hypothetical protein EZS27_018756 [termite gut metagenome]|uniref:Phosphoribosylanthranilate isomerase n=1 Tax=termite gut metagenome TaxID=433724 RepID=A0A5J4RGS5_9ZZZZ
MDKYEGQTPFLLSGGISMESIETLKEFTHPRWAGIDINSRFEAVVPLIGKRSQHPYEMSLGFGC